VLDPPVLEVPRLVFDRLIFNTFAKVSELADVFKFTWLELQTGVCPAFKCKVLSAESKAIGWNVSDVSDDRKKNQADYLEPPITPNLRVHRIERECLDFTCGVVV
jgi:hypothetical protein